MVTGFIHNINRPPLSAATSNILRYRGFIEAPASPPIAHSNPVPSPTIIVPAGQEDFMIRTSWTATVSNSCNSSIAVLHETAFDSSAHRPPLTVVTKEPVVVCLPFFHVAFAETRKQTCYANPHNPNSSSTGYCMHVTAVIECHVLL